MAQEKAERFQFVNNTDGHVGAIQYKPNGDEQAIAVEPHGTVWLSVAEQELTAKAPRDAKDNPFMPQQVPVIDPNTNEQVGTRTITPLTLNDEERPIPSNNARPIPGSGKLRPEAQAALEAEAAKGDAPDGTLAPDEEVGTPTAQKPAAAKRRRAPKKLENA
jgi:hypothetical protein